MSPSLLELPVECIHRMWKSLPPASQVAFVSVCKQFYRQHSLDVVHARLQDLTTRTPPILLALSPHRTLVRRRVKYRDYHEDAKDRAEDDRCTNDDCDDGSDGLMCPGSSKCKDYIAEDWVLQPWVAKLPEHDLARPFVVLAAKFTPARDDIMLHVAFPDYTTPSSGQVQVLAQVDSVQVAPEFAEEVKCIIDELEADYDAETLDTEVEIDGPFSYKLALSQTGCVFGLLKEPATLRRWFLDPCPECHGSCDICPGCGGISDRWPDAFGSCGYSLPCPMCVGYDTTLEARYIMEDDQRTIDEDLSVAPVRVRRWSKAKWEAHLTETVQEDCDDAAGDSDDEES